MSNTWSRRQVLSAGAGLAASGIALEVLSLLGSFDNKRLRAAKDARFGEQLFALDGLAHGGVLHIGQSTHLIALGGVRVMTDPWFFDPAFGSLKHPQPLPVSPQAIDGIDVIAITHDHPDHADRLALDRLDKNALVVVGVPELVAPIKALGFHEVEHVPAGTTIRRGALAITATAAIHDVPEAGFVFECGAQSIYFAGDSATHPELPAIAERWALSLAILPIDGTRLRWEPRLVMDPLDAAKATAVLHPKQVMSSHADAVQGDWIAAHWLSESAPNPGPTFRQLVAKLAPSVRCHVPAPCELVALETS